METVFSYSVKNLKDQLLKNKVLLVNVHNASFTLQLGLMHLESSHGFISLVFCFMCKLAWS